jgi:hypothetical protein
LEHEALTAAGSVVYNKLINFMLAEVRRGD